LVFSRKDAPVTAYLITHITIGDPDALRRYEAHVGPIVEQFAGQILARGGDARGTGGDAAIVLEGDLSVDQRHALVGFPNLDSAQRFYDSDAYRPWRTLREAGSTASTVLIDGLSDATEESA
jgi:uncharacterized protein (DUF1330 family)